jgi:hypothetical protein
VASTRNSKPKIQENPLIAKLIGAGAENARVLRGFIGPSRDADHITLYQSLARLADNVEIQRADVLYAVEAPQSGLGAVILWVNSEAQLGVRTTQTDSHPTTGPGSHIEAREGRLRMRLRTMPAADVCTSNCNICTSQCTCLMAE